jgi:YVTN family beta-propeller protein
MGGARFKLAGGLKRAVSLVVVLAMMAALAGPARAAEPGLHLMTKIVVAPAPGPIAVNPATNTVYVGDYTNSTVSVINGATNRVTASIPIPGRPVAVAVDPSTSTLYVSNRYHAIFVISGATDQITATINAKGYVPDIDIDPGADLIYAMALGLGEILVINGATNTIIQRISCPSADELAVDPAAGLIYAAGEVSAPGDGQSWEMKAISTSTGAITWTVALDGALGSLAVNPATDTVYVVHYRGATPQGISVIDGQTGTETASIGPRAGPQGIAVDPGTNTFYVAIANQNGPHPINRVLEFSGATDTVVAAAPAGDTPGSIALNPDTGTVYAGDFDSDTVAVITGS